MTYSYTTLWDVTLSGGYQVRASANPSNPIPDIRQALQEADGVSLDDFQAIGSFTGVRVGMKQEGTEKDPVEDRFIRGVDEGYTNSVTYPFALMAAGYDTPRDVWKALQEEPGTVVVDDFMVPTRNDFDVGGSGPDSNWRGSSWKTRCCQRCTFWRKTLVPEMRNGCGS